MVSPFSVCDTTEDSMKRRHPLDEKSPLPDEWSSSGKVVESESSNTVAAGNRRRAFWIFFRLSSDPK